MDHLGGARDGTFYISINQGDKRFRKARKVPLRDDRLIGVSIAAATVDGAKHRRWIIMIHKGAWAVVDRLTGDRHVVGVHHAMNEAHMHPAGNERRLSLAHALKQSQVGIRVV